jgi:membrane associated rhomboid family serine protease
MEEQDIPKVAGLKPSSARDMNNHVVDSTASTQSDLGGQYWRLLTSTFVHNNPLHLLGNLFFLWILGKRLELRDGRQRSFSFETI